MGISVQPDNHGCIAIRNKGQEGKFLGVLRREWQVKSLAERGPNATGKDAGGRGFGELPPL